MATPKWFKKAFDAADSVLREKYQNPSLHWEVIDETIAVFYFLVWEGDSMIPILLMITKQPTLSYTLSTLKTFSADRVK